MVISDPAGLRFLEVKVKKDLENKNASTVPHGAFGTLDITYGSHGALAEPRHLIRVPGVEHKISPDFLGFHIRFRKMRRGHHIRNPVVGGFHRECAEIAGNLVHFVLCSSPAEEYYGNFLWLSLRYMHLDLYFDEIRDNNQLTGLLPELWGFQPETKTTTCNSKANDKESQNAGGPMRD